MAKILIVDDSHDIANAVATLLAQRGHDVRVAYDGREALRQASEELPAVMLLDIGMPSMDGIEVARRIRRTHGNELKIVACTGYAERSISASIAAQEFDAILLKPVPFDRIFETIEALANDGPTLAEAQ